MAGSPSQWEAVDFVVRREPVPVEEEEKGEEGEGGKNFANALYKVLYVPLGHADVKSDKDVVTLQWLRPINDSNGGSNLMGKKRGLL